MSTSTTNQNLVLPDYNDWPIIKLNENKSEFHNAAKKEALERIFTKYDTEGDFKKIIEKTIDSEKRLINKEENSTINIPKFWEDIEDFFLKNSGDTSAEKEILSKIIDFYLESISGDFSIYHYNLAKRGVSYTLSRLLYPMSLPYTDGLVDENIKLCERIKIDGKIDEVRSLMKKGIVVLLPTHFSNLDSAVLAWATESLGLPPFLYAAGVNLFSNKFWDYTLSRVGTYKIDRAKKNLIYLITVDAYLVEVVKWGCNTIFYPHGGRSRSGSIEKELKKGLLSAVISSQEKIFKQEGIYGKKIFLVPVTMNYPFVLEAPLFAKKCLENFLGDDSALSSELSQKESFDIYEKFLSITSFTKRLFMDEATLSVIFGQPIDILGNPVNELGKSFCDGNPISVYQTIEKNENNFLKSRDHFKYLTDKIITEQCRCSVIQPCHLLSYAAIYVFKNMIKHDENENVYKKIENYIINYYEIFEKFKQLIEAIFYIKENNLGLLDDAFIENDLEYIFQKSFDELGAYHSIKPLKKTEDGDFICKDLGILIYYSNRLAHYFEIFENPSLYQKM